MSSKLRDILTPFEQTPPAGVWDRIAQELDEWTPLAATARVLQDWQTPPPPAAWNRIREEMEEQLLASRLQELETSPPAHIWPAVAEQLEAPARPATIRPWFRYAAAALITGVLAWAGLRLLDSSPASTPSASSGVKSADSPSGKDPLNDQQARQNLANIIESTRPPANAPEEIRSEKALEASKKTVARVEPGLIRRKLETAAAFSFERPDPPVAAPDPSRRYVVLLTPDGNMIRMSKKLKDMLCCLTGEDSDPNCQEQVRKWQEKIIHAPGSNSPGNFADLLDILNALNENR